MPLSRRSGTCVVTVETGAVPGQGGATWADVLAAAAPHGLAPVLAHDVHGGVVEGVRGGGGGWQQCLKAVQQPRRLLHQVTGIRHGDPLSIG